MALDNLTGQNIQDTYQRVVQTDGNTFADGTGSALQIITSDQTGSMSVATASYAISASHEITYELSSSHAETADALTPGIDIDVRNITSSGNLDIKFDISQSRGVLTTPEIRLTTTNGLHNANIGLPIQTNYLQITNPNDGPVIEAALRGKVTIFGEEFAIPEVDKVYGLHITDLGIKLDGVNGHLSASGNIENKGDLKVHGNITASGNISTSLDLISNRLNTNTIHPHIDSQKKLTIAGWSTFTGNVTSSGIISSSENIIGRHLFAYGEKGAIMGGITRVGSGVNTKKGRLILYDDDNHAVDLNPLNDSYISGSNIQLGIGTKSPSSSLTVEGNIQSRGTAGHITASGNISSSGRIFGSSIRIPNGDNSQYSLFFGTDPADDNGFIYDDGSHLILGYNDTDVIKTSEEGSGRVSIEGNMTVSGPITASGIIKASGSGINAVYIGGVGGHISASGNISSSGTITADDLYLPSTSPTTTANLLYVSSSAGVTGSRSANNLMYSGSMIATGMGVIHIMHGSYKKTAAHTTETYLSFGTGDKENTSAGNGYVRYHPPYGGKIRKFTAAGSLGGSKIGATTFKFYKNNSEVTDAACSETINPQDSMIDIDFNDAAVFDKGDKLQITLTTGAADGTDYWIYWNCVFEFNVV